MNMVIHAPVTASIMLTGSAILAAVLLRMVKVQTPRLRQLLLLGVLLQGVMLFRVPVQLPVLEPDNADVASATDPMVAAFHDVHRESTQIAPGRSHGDAIPAFALPGEVGRQDSDERAQTVSLASVSGADKIKRLIYSVAVVWLAGFAFVLIRSGLVYVRLCHLIGRLNPAPPDWFSEWDAFCKSKNLVTPVMLVSDTVGPMLVRRFGGYALVVPSGFWGGLSENQRRGVLLHELAHLCRRDVWRQILVRAIAALHWWNPAAWWCVKRYEEATEWACDECLTKNDPDAARGLASSLVQLLEFIESGAPHSGRVMRGIGVQSMAAPPLTQRVKRLLEPAVLGDSTMKRLLFGSLAAGLLTVSAIQFQLVAAPPEQNESIQSDSSEGEQRSDLEVLSPQAMQQLASLQERLDQNDEATKLLSKLLATDAGKIAFAGALDQLEDRHRNEAKADAIPRFIKKHFEMDPDGKFAIKPEYAELPQQWLARSEKLGDALDKLSERMTSIADRIKFSEEADLMAKRMLTHEHAALVITLEEFDGQVDPTDRFLAEAFEDLLVKRRGKMIVVPTLGKEERKQIQRYEKATEIFQRLASELKGYGKEFATPDERHKRLVSAMATNSFIAVLAIELSDDDEVTAASAVEGVFENLEHASRDTPAGLVIREERAWEHLDGLLDLSDRAAERLADAEASLKKIVETLDRTDPMTDRFAKQLELGVLKYHVASEIRYAELDLAEQIEEMISNVMEPVGENGLRVREDVAGHVMERASDILSSCRKIGRYVRQVNSFVDQLEDQQLANELGRTGRLVLLSEIRDSVEHDSVDVMSLLEKELFQESSEGANAKLTIRSDRTNVVRELAERAEELKSELASDDF